MCALKGARGQRSEDENDDEGRGRFGKEASNCWKKGDMEKRGHAGRKGTGQKIECSNAAIFDI
jgi:hypothetical protein